MIRWTATSSISSNSNRGPLLAAEQALRERDVGEPLGAIGFAVAADRLAGREQVGTRRQRRDLRKLRLARSGRAIEQDVDAARAGVDSALEHAGDQVAIGRDMVVVLHRHQGDERIAEQRVAHLVERAERAFEAGVDARGDRIARIVAGERGALIAHLQQPGGDEFAAWRQQFLGRARMHVTEQRHRARDRPAVVGGGVGEILHLLEPARAGEKPEQPPGRMRQSQRFDEALGVGRQRFGTRRLGGGPLESVEHVLFVPGPRPLEFRRLVGHVAAEQFHQRRRQRQGQHVGALVEPDQQAADGPLRQIRPAQQAHEIARHQATLDIGNHGHAWFAADCWKEVTLHRS